MINQVHCSLCGEPNNTYYLNNEYAEVEENPDDAAEMLLNGEGCPTCDWGDKAGDVSTSRFKNEDELEAEHIKDIMNNTDKDPIKYL